MSHVSPGLGARFAVRLSRSLLSAFLLWFGIADALAAGNVIQYTYDAAGNITNIQRQTAPGFAITSFTPTSGPVGTAVTIYGTGFSATPANNTVQFNGTAATVSASGAGSISTTVPAGATTGRITVTVNGVAATSATDFVVVVPGAPTITSFSPTSGAGGVTVTMTGTNFDPAAGATTVKLNGVTGLSSVTDSSTLTFTVPGGAASGKLSVTTSTGSGTSAGDFIVPPPGMVATDIATSIRISAGGGSANVAVPGSSKSGVVLFDAQPNVYYSLQLSAMAISPTTASVAYKVINPDNTVLQSGFVTGSSRPTIHLPLLPSAGTYSLVLSPGTATFNSNVRLGVDPSTTVDGAPLSSSLDFAYQSARFSFTAIANQHVGIGIANLSFMPANGSSISVSVIGPDGLPVTGASATCNAPSIGNPHGDCDAEFIAPSTGTYLLLADSPTTAFANETVQLTTEVAGALSADVSQVVTLSRVGQDARFTFVANAGDSLALDLSNATLLPEPQTVRMVVYKPDGTTLTSCSSTPPAGMYCELLAVPSAGTYTVYVDPALGAYGSFNLTLKQGPLLVANDPATSFAPAGFSESARFRFSGTAGQNLSLGVTGLVYAGTGSGSTAFSVVAPNGASVGIIGFCSPTVQGGNCRAWLVNLPQTGIYRALLQPPAGVTVSGNISLSTEITGTLVPATPQTLSSRPGQAARLSFTGNAGDSVAVKVFGAASNISTSILNLYVYKSDGTLLASSSVGTQTEALFNFPSLPATGTYSLVMDPASGQTWQATVDLDPGSPISIDGPAVNPLTTVAGEPLRYAFTATAAQRIDFGLSGLTYAAASSSATSIAIYSPTGATVASSSCLTSGIGSCDAIIASAPATGTYSMIVTPPQTSSITGGTIALSTPLAGAFVIGDPSQTVAVSRPGQTARYTFTGTSGQLLRINWSGATIQGNNTVNVSIVKPDGTTLASTSFANGANSGLSIPALPTTDTYTVFLNPSSGATFSAVFSLVTQ